MGRLFHVVPYETWFCHFGIKFVECQGLSIKFLSDPKLKPVQYMIDAVVKHSDRQVLNLQSKQAMVLLKVMENILLSRGLLKESSPTTLLNSMVFVLGTHFALRAVMNIVA